MLNRIIRKKAVRTGVSGWALFFALNLAPAALAQTVPAQDSGAQPEGVGQSDEIVVTAQKREELLSDTPTSVSVLSPEQLSNLSATKFQDFANTVPGLSFQTGGPGYTQISLRGVSVGQDVAPTVAVYVDDVPYGSSTTFGRGGQISLDAGLFDLDHIEVLRGPQGTLYGASTVGGLIKYVTKAPDTSEFDGKIQAGISTTRHGSINFELAGVINVPLAADKAALRLSAFQSHDGGYIDNVQLGREDINRSDIYGTRADLLLTPTDRFSVRIGGYFQNTKSDGLPTVDYTRAGQPSGGALEQRRLIPERFDQRYRLASLTLGYDIDWAQLTSISSYQTIKSTLLVDGTVLYLPSLPVGVNAATVGFSDISSTKKFTQELRFASSGGKAIDWFIGGFYTHETSDLDAAYVLHDANGAFIPNTVYSFSGPSKYEEYAVFGSVTVHLTDELDITGGTRYAHNQQRFQQIGGGAFGLSAPETRASEGVFTYLANIRYKPSEQFTAYARFATGYRPGGPNLLVQDPVTGDPLGLPTFEPDTLDSYEAGVKWSTADRRFSGELAGYYVNWDNIQTNLTVRGFGTKVNAPTSARIKGGELTLRARPIDELSFVGTFGYQDGTIKDAVPSIAASAGERLPSVPEFTAFVGVDYEDYKSPLRPSFGGSLRFISDSQTIFGPNGYHLPDYTLVELHAGIAPGPVKLNLFVKNLLDARPQVTPRFRYFTAANPQVTILQPRTIGVSASLDF